MQYTVVYDTLNGDPHWWYLPLIPALMASMGAALVVYFARNPDALYERGIVIPFRRDPTPPPAVKRRRTKREIRMALFKFLFTVFWSLGTMVLTVGTFVLAFNQWRNTKARFAAGDFVTVEGVVTNFIPGDPGDHTEESFEVSGRKYRYRAAELGNGYNKTQNHGGQIRDGLRVRVSEMDGVIRKLEIVPMTAEQFDAVGHAALRDSLYQLRAEDQAGRENIPKAVAANDTATLFRMMRADSARSRWLRTQYARWGWPTRTLVGDSAASIAWLILQHTPYLDFQREVLPDLEKLAAVNEVSAIDVAMLKDRVLKSQNMPQEYGTQFDVKDGKLVAAPIRDLPGLDARRSAIGLPPMQDYVRKLQQETKLSVIWPPQ